MSTFDPIRAQREVLAGFADVHKVLLVRARDAERRLSEAEADFNALTKIEAFLRGVMKDARARLEELEEAAEAIAKQSEETPT